MLPVLNPLVAGVIVASIPIVLIAVRKHPVSASLGAGIVLGLSLLAALFVVAWAVTTHLDVFRASGWALPAKRFILVAPAILILFGAAWHAWSDGYRGRDGDRDSDDFAKR